MASSSCLFQINYLIPKIPFHKSNIPKDVSFPSQKNFFEILFWENFNMFKNNRTFVKLAIQLGYATSEWTHYNYSL
jgi:hypothetical protein